MKRSYLSGSDKRKLKRKKEDEKKSLQGSLAKFVKKTLVKKSDDETQVDIAVSTSEEITIGDEVASSNLKNIQQDEKLKPSLEEESSKNFDSDPALWTVVDEKMREYFTQFPPQQNINLISKTERVINNQKRWLSEHHFFRKKCNEDKVKRDWLILSASSGALFCWICKLFSSSENSLSSGGFTDWKHVSERLQDHENSYFHREAVCAMTLRKEACARIDVAIADQNISEHKYWFNVLRRVVSVTKFLSIRGMAFFGKNETLGSANNGNFLGCMELLSEYDPFLAKHLQKYGNPGKGHTSYLSSTIITEFIELMGNKVLDTIISEVKTAKYFSIILDSTPDLSHSDQLCFIVRYVSLDNEPIERFLTFLPIHSHGSEHLEKTALQFMAEKEIPIEYCRGQSYDNASNMSGGYSGLQTRIKAINPLAEFVPCAAHSLNLVVVKGVECNGRILDFFTFLQELYNFFSASTHRWKLLNDCISKKNSKGLTLKSRSCTRWCANADATKALHLNYTEVMETLNFLSSNMEESPSTRHDASSLYEKLGRLETGIFIKTWDAILQRVNTVSKILQSPDLDLSNVPSLFSSLIEFVDFIRGMYDEYEQEASLLVGHKNYIQRRKVKPPKHLDDGPAPNVDFDCRDHFRISCFNVICDTLISHLKSRNLVYEETLKKFSCLFESDKQAAYEKAKHLQSTYSQDLEKSFPDEYVHFMSITDKENSVIDKLKKMKKVGIADTFANVETALKIFLTLPISNCSGERSFSLLKRVKSPLRSVITDSKLSLLSILSIEGDITKMLDYEDVISDFTAKKFRKKIIKK